MQSDAIEVRQKLELLADRVLQNYRGRDGLTGYAFDHNRERDQRYMRETFSELVAPFIARLSTSTPDTELVEALREIAEGGGCEVVGPGELRLLPYEPRQIARTALARLQSREGSAG